MTKEAMKLALEAMQYADACLKKQLTTKTKHEYAQDLLLEAGKALEEALKQEQGEPVAYVNDQYSRDGYNDEISKLLPVGTYLYTTPQTKEWVGLNGADWNDFNPLKSNDPHRVADWVEKILKERNT